ncbi:hypothetical protein ACOSQ4_009314 [Xanthoceras sorbifolium]
MNFIFEERRTLWVRDRTLSVRDRTQRGSISNLEGFEDRTLLGSCLRTQKGSCLRTLLGSISNPEGFEDRTLLGSRSNPEGSIFEPSGFHEPRGFVLRTLWVPRTQKGSYLRTLLGSRSNPEGSIFEPSGFHEPSQRVRSSNPEGSRSNPEPFWVRSRTLWVPLGSISNPLGSTNPEGFEDRTLLGFEPSGFVEPRGFDLEPRRVRRYEPFWVRGTQRVRRSNPLGSISNPEGFDLRTLWVQSRTQRVRGSSKMNFEDELRR